MARDLTIDNDDGSTVETRRVGFRPDTDLHWPGAKDSWVVLCTVPGARGPFTEQRTVVRTAWEPADERSRRGLEASRAEAR